MHQKLAKIMNLKGILIMLAMIDTIIVCAQNVQLAVVVDDTNTYSGECADQCK